MHRSTSEASRPIPPADIEGRLTAELASVVAGARRRALRDGDRQLDTAHLLHSLMESDPAVRAVFDDGRQVARVLGYLVQRSIGYGLRWQGSVEDSGAAPLMAQPGWSPSALSAMEHALRRAAARGDGDREGRDGDGGYDGDGAPDGDRVTGPDLLAALAADPECRAVEVLRHAGVDPAALTAADPVALLAVDPAVRRATGQDDDSAGDPAALRAIAPPDDPAAPVVRTA
ncbi:Clp protease N-terminal domain-containing protein [Streptomyces sp. NPDC048111]|uniref:Clp protease N-terminal domain-containing protein n=1 Tax=Streptomyces sp. NPDC048111 TaxID=3365500 RepID=UPI00371DF7B9